MADIVIVVSTAIEGEGIPRAIGRTSIAVLETGVGPVNAAFALTRCLTAAPARAVVACGIGGAYAGTGVHIGDVLCASTETYGDLGAATVDGFLDMQALGFPVIDGENPLYNTLPLDLFPAARRVPFVTTTTCTGRDADARAIAARTGGVIESMEGAAIVHVARLMGVPVGEIRGVSNVAGRRDRDTWRVREAAAAAREALVAWIEANPC
jgi:futalosine hydrolase